MVFKLGDDASIRFWDDVWCDDFLPKLVYSELYQLACSHAAFVADVHC